MNARNPSVDGYIRKNKRWREELEALRRIILQCPLVEEVKWRAPCYTHEAANVVMLGSCKEGCVLSFLKGALLKDPRGLLAAPGPNTQSARVIRFTSLKAVEDLEPVIRGLILEAVEAEKAGLKVAFKKITDFPVPEELQKKLDESPELKKAFESLTPGRQRAYLLFISSARRSRTRQARVEKHRRRILQGKGLED